MAGVSVMIKTHASAGHRAVEGFGQRSHPCLSVVEEVGLRGCLDHAVLQLDVTELERREEVLVRWLRHRTFLCGRSDPPDTHGRNHKRPFNNDNPDRLRSDARMDALL
jgi:type II secretory pathway component PulJ